MTAAPVPHPVIPVLAERGGTQLTTPRATVLVDTREQNPFNFSRFKGWFAGIEKKALALGDYSVAKTDPSCFSQTQPAQTHSDVGQHLLGDDELAPRTQEVSTALSAFNGICTAGEVRRSLFYSESFSQRGSSSSTWGSGHPR
jgi:hypothetical protein